MSWEKFTNYFEVEPRWVDCKPGQPMAAVEDLVAACDENTIGGWSGDGQGGWRGGDVCMPAGVNDGARASGGRLCAASAVTAQRVTAPAEAGRAACLRA